GPGVEEEADRRGGEQRTEGDERDGAQPAHPPAPERHGQGGREDGQAGGGGGGRGVPAGDGDGLLGEHRGHRRARPRQQRQAEGDGSEDEDDDDGASPAHRGPAPRRALRRRHPCSARGCRAEATWTARRAAAALLRDSSYSSSGTESATIPAPAWTL